MYGITGTHRVGKTTLAKHLAKEMDVPYLDADVSGVFKSLGFEANQPMDFKTRMKVQYAILESCRGKWREMGRQEFVCDRTPMCFMGYTLCDATPNSGFEYDILKDYMDACYEAANQFFSTIIYVQPGIQLVVDKEKQTAAMDRCFMEKQSAVIGGLMASELLLCKKVRLGRKNLRLENRVDAVLSVLAEFKTRAMVSTVSRAEGFH